MLHMQDLMTLYTSQPKQYVCWSGQSNHRVGTEEFGFIEEYRYLGQVMIADCRDHKDIKKQFTSQNAVGNMVIRKFSFPPIEAKI